MLKIKNILVPVDFSEGSLHAVEYAASIARESKAVVHLLHVVQKGVNSAFLKENITDDHLMEVLLTDARLKGITVIGRILEGTVLDAILKEQKNTGCGLIVMGTLGASGLKKLFFGSNTTAVLKKAGVPVLAVPSGVKYTSIKKIILATDLKSDNLEVANENLDILKPFQAELEVFYVDTQNELVDETVYKMEQVSARVKKHIDFPNMTYHVSTYKNVEQGLFHFIEKSNADLLVMVTHHHSISEAIFNPSHTNGILFHCPLPVLAIPFR